jgi:hypothetical protein
MAHIASLQDFYQVYNHLKFVQLDATRHNIIILT